MCKASRGGGLPSAVSFLLLFQVPNLVFCLKPVFDIRAGFIAALNVKFIRPLPNSPCQSKIVRLYHNSFGV